MALNADKLRREFLAWLRSGVEAFDVEDVDAEGDSLIMQVEPAAVAAYVERLSASALDTLVGGMVPEPAVGDAHSIEVPSGSDYETWTEAKRRRANIAAIVALRRWRESQRPYLTDEERKALLAFSGWGGIKIGRLPTDPTIWPADFLEALRDFQAARAERRAPKFDTFRGLLQQFFTPVPVARFMVELAARVVRRPIQSVLEPSAGVGRFLGAMTGQYGHASVVPDDAIQFLGEYDPFLQQIEAALYPTAIRAASAFEIVGRRLDTSGLPGPFDMVVSNPPYPRRTRLYRDEHGYDWVRAAAYFTWASMRLLAPGGVLCTLVPIGQMTAPDNEAVTLRRFLLQEAELVSVVALPADVFPGALVQTVVHTWVKRPKPLTTEELTALIRTDERAAAIVKGKTITRTLGETTPFGTWVTSQRWKTDLELKSNGAALSVDALELAPTTTPMQVGRTASHLDEVRELLEKTAAAASQSKLGQIVQRSIHAEATTILGVALALDTRLSHFLHLRGGDSAAQITAESSRVELLGDVEAFIEQWGNPHRSDVLRANQRQVSTLLAVVARNGQITDVLRDAVTEDIQGSLELGQTTDAQQIVEFYCERLGECPESKLDRHMPVVPEFSELPEEICLWIDPSGAIKLYTKDAYLSGALYPRLDNIKAVLAGDPPEWLRNRMYRQKEWLTEALGERSIAEIEITPASGFLTVPGDDPWAILNEYIAWKIKNYSSEYEQRDPCVVKLYQESRRFVISRTGNWPSRTTEPLRVPQAIDPTDFEIELPDGTRIVDQQAYREAVRKENEAQRNAKKYPSAWVFVLRFLGYLNNDMEIPDPDGGKTKDTATRRYSVTDFDTRKAEDDAIIEDFRSWLVAQEHWHDVVTLQYNRVYRGYAAGVPSDKPIPIARWSERIRLGAHQNQGIRWFAARGTGIIAFNVGLGKCRRAGSLQVTNRGVLRVDALVGPRPDLAPGTAEVIPVTGLRVPAAAASGLVWRDVRALYRQRLDDAEHTIRVLTARGGGDEVTAAHRFRGVDPTTGEITWRFARDVKPGDFLVTAGEWATEHTAWPEPVAGWSTERRAALVRALTWMLTEGHESHNRLVVTQKDGHVRSTIARDLEVAFEVSVVETIPDDDRHVGYVSVTASAVRDLCMALGYPWGRASADRHIPAWFFTLEAADRAMVASILMDAEGCVLASGGVEWTSASQRLAEDTRALLGSLGIAATVRSRRVRGYEQMYWRLTLFSDAAARFQALGGFQAYPDKNDCLRAALEGPRNPNRAGVPCAWFARVIRTVGLPLPGVDTRNAAWSHAHAQEVLEKLEYRLSPEGRAAWCVDAEGVGTTRRWACAGLVALAEHRERLEAAAKTLRSLVESPYGFVEVEHVEAGESGGYVYDLSVEAERDEEQSYVAGFGGLIQHNTFTGLGAIAWERQNGRARRVVVVVPDALVVNWYREALAGLPDYRVCTIGYVPDEAAPTNLKEISNDARAVQWKQAALGAFEVVITGYAKFLRDVELSPSESRRYLEKLSWLQSGDAEDEERLALLERKLAEAKRTLAKYEALVTRGEELGGTEVQVGESIVSLDGLRRQVVKYQSEVTALEQEIGSLGGEVSEGGIERVRDRVEDLLATIRPRGAEVVWRPSDGLLTLRTHLTSILTQAGGGVLAEGAKAKFKGTDWEADYKANARKLDSWLEGLKKAEIVAMLGEFDPPDYEAAEASPVPAMVSWEALRVDLLVVDEAHNFKNLFAPARQPFGASTVAYMGPPPGNTQRCWDMWLKTQYVLERNKERGVLLLTATPEKNSPLEVYNLINYVSRDCWTSRGINKPEDFVSRYIIVGKAWVPRPNRGDDAEASTEVINTEAVTGFKSQLELWVARDQFTLARTVDDVPELKARVPESLERRIDFDLDPVQMQLYRDASAVIRQMQADQKEAEAAGDGKADPSLGLRLIDLLGKIALDPRLLEANYAETKTGLANVDARTAKYEEWQRRGGKGKPPPKPYSEKKLLGLNTTWDILQALAMACADRLGIEMTDLDRDDPNKALPVLLRRLFPASWIPPKYRKLAEVIHEVGTGCGHIVFTDNNDAIQRIRNALVAGGIDPDRIGVMSATAVKTVPARQALMDAFNGTLKYDSDGQPIPGSGSPPEIDILIGTSATMGEGANLQVRTCVVHHVTLPWDPASIEQRNGRAVRQGNVLKLRDNNFRVTLMYYLAKYTTDAQKYDAILGKGAWQQLLKVSDAADREDEVQNPAASYERVVRILALAEQDPEKSLAKLAEARAAMEAASLHRQRLDIIKRLQGLDGTARKVRGAYNDSERTIQARQYEAKAKQLLRVGASMAVNLEAAILRILEKPTYYDIDSGLLISRGDRIQVTADNNTSKVEIWNTGLDGYFVARPFGTIKTVMVYSLPALASVAYAYRPEASPAHTTVVPAEWDEAKDQSDAIELLFLTKKPMSQYGREEWERIRGFGLDRLWQRPWINVPSYLSSVIAPLEPGIPVVAPDGMVFVMAPSPMATWIRRVGGGYSGQHVSYPADMTAMYDWLRRLRPATFEEFVEALSEDRAALQVDASEAEIVVPLPGLADRPAWERSANRDGAFRLLNLWNNDDRGRVELISSVWFGTYLRPEMIRSIKAAIRQARKATGGVLPPMSTADMRAEAEP